MKKKKFYYIYQDKKDNKKLYLCNLYKTSDEEKKYIVYATTGKYITTDVLPIELSDVKSIPFTVETALKIITLYNINKEKNQLAENIKSERGYVNQLRRDVENLLDDIKMSFKRMIRYKKRVKEIQEIKININIEKQIKKLEKSKKIKSVEIDFPYLIIRTKGLIYKDELYSNLNIGTFTIIFHMLEKDYKVFNNTYHVENYYHPCIKKGDVCTGDSVSRTMDKYLQDGQYALATYLLINFLEEPNYSSPYIEAKNFDINKKRQIYKIDSTWYRDYKLYH